jgi:hypothetical protein
MILSEKQSSKEVVCTAMARMAGLIVKQKSKPPETGQEFGLAC